MHNLSAVAIATLSSRVLETRDLQPRAGAVGALKVTCTDDALAFSFHVHAPSVPSALQQWMDALVADDPLLVGYRLTRTSRLLCRSGYDRSLLGSFGTAGRHDVLTSHRPRPLLLSVIAARYGIAAIDEMALLCARPLEAAVACDLALVNAVASWVIYVGRCYPGSAGEPSRRSALGQLSTVLSRAATSTVLTTAMMGAVQ